MLHNKLLLPPADVCRVVEAPQCGAFFTAAIWGRPINWSIDQLGGDGNPVFAEQVGCVLALLGARRGFATGTIKRNARILEPAALSRKINVGHQVLFCNPNEPADGVYLQQGDAGLTSTSGCPIFFAARRGYVPVYAHAGRDCLINRSRIDPRDPAPLRDHANESVCFSVLQALEVSSWKDAAEVYVWVYWGAHPHQQRYSFGHPEYGAFNRRMYTYIVGRWGHACASLSPEGFSLNLTRLIRAQFLERGVLYSHIDTKDGYLDEQTMWSDCSATASRNLIAIVCNS